MGILCVASFLVNLLVGLLYPIYSSLSLISNKNKEEEVKQADVQKWVSYWIIYAILSKIFCCDCIENEYIISFLNIVQIGTILFLALPQMNGSLIVYEKVFKNSENTKDWVKSQVKALMEKACSCCKGKCGENK